MTRAHLAGLVATTALLALAMALGGCVPAPVEPAVIVTPAPQDPAVARAREVLSTPVVTVSVAISRTVDAVDAARHRVARGAPQVGAVEEVRVEAAALRNHVEALQLLAADLDSPSTVRAVDAAGALADLGEAVAAEAVADVAALEPLIAIDAQMADLIDAWDQPGSRSEQTEAFAQLVQRSRQLVLDAARLPMAACDTARHNRLAWAALIADRTQQLDEVVQVADGLAFDELREDFERAPYGEDRVVADAEGEACWQQASPLTEAPDRAAALLMEVQAALNPDG